MSLIRCHECSTPLGQPHRSNCAAGAQIQQQAEQYIKYGGDVEANGLHAKPRPARPTAVAADLPELVVALHRRIDEVDKTADRFTDAVSKRVDQLAKNVDAAMKGLRGEMASRLGDRIGALEVALHIKARGLDPTPKNYERELRVYYQDLLYKLANLLDSVPPTDGHLTTQIGNPRQPSDDIVRRLKNLFAMKGADGPAEVRPIQTTTLDVGHVEKILSRMNARTDEAIILDHAPDREKIARFLVDNLGSIQVKMTTCQVVDREGLRDRILTAFARMISPSTLEQFANAALDVITTAHPTSGVIAGQGPSPSLADGLAYKLADDDRQLLISILDGTARSYTNLAKHNTDFEPIATMTSKLLYTLRDFPELLLRKPKGQLRSAADPEAHDSI